MSSTLARIGVLLPAAAFLGYWALLVYCEVWRPTPLGLRLTFDAARIAVVDTVPVGRSAGGPTRRRPPDRVRRAFHQRRLDWMAVQRTSRLAAMRLSVE
jgi:hypothetical protein